MKVQIVITPHIPYGLEACMFYEQTQGVLFSSDLGAQPGINPPFSDKSLIPKILDFQEKAGFVPLGEN